MPFTSNATRPCMITMCKRRSSTWKTVTEHVISKGQTNNTLPNYTHLGNTICLNCYNGIVINSSSKFQQHAQTITMEQVEINETDESMKLRVLTICLFPKQ